MYLIKKIDDHFFIQLDQNKIRELTDEELSLVKDKLEEVNTENFAAIYVDEELDYIEV